MIRLKRVNRPKKLTPAKQAELTRLFVATGERVWNHSGIPSALKKMGRGKCGYCECKVGVESNYLEVEHFRYKDKYQKLVVAWNNLLPSCKRCNGKKGNLDVEVTPLIFPRTEWPHAHLELEVYFLKDGSCCSILMAKGDSEKGRNSVTEIGLNDDRVTEARNPKIGALEREIRELALAAKRIADGSINDQESASFSEKLRAVLSYCLPRSQYGGSLCSFLLAYPPFQGIKEIAVASGIWEDWHSRSIEKMERHRMECRISDLR